MDVVAFIIGFILGVISVGLALELGIKKASTSEPATRSTRKWSISEMANPRVIAEYLSDDVEIPKNAKVIVNQYKNEAMLAGVEAKKHSGIRGNFIVGDDRALILAGPIKKDELGIWTVEKDVIDKLTTYFDESWAQATNMNQEEKR